MRVSTALSVALVVGNATAAPTPSLISSILGLLTKDISSLLSSLGIKIYTDGSSHGTPWSKGISGSSFVNWRTFKANGANLGGWLEKEKTHDPVWWDSVGGSDAPDEWTLCQTLGSKCDPILEERYASFLNTSTIDKLASVGFLFELYHGNQQSYLKTITQYAITKYNMHIIVSLHSLPGGVNNLDIGEALFHQGWFNNATNLDYSFQAVDGILNFIKTSGHINAFTIAPINEASDNFAGFGSSAGLTVNATNWINTFAAAGTYSNYVNPAVCGQAAYIAEETKFPVFIGEWLLQAMYNNTLAGHKTIFDTQWYAWQKYVSGGAFWTAISYSTASVDGEGTQREYWSYIDQINDGIITSATKSSYC